MPDSSVATRSTERSALFVATMTSFLGPFMISSVNVALPTIQADLHLNAVQLSWTATAYLLAMAVALVPAGKIADIHGRKRVFSYGLVIFTLATALTAGTISGAMLIALRGLQGLGAALFVTTGMAILTSIFPPERRGGVIGIYVAAVYIGLSAGPFFGGVLTQHLGWRSLFIATSPLGLLCIFLTHRFLQGEWTDPQAQRFDLGGCLLYGASILSLVYGASRLPSAIGAFLVFSGAALLLGFIRHQARSPYPVLDISLFQTNRTFAFSSLAALLNYSATFAVNFLLSLYLQYIQAMTPQHAGTILIAQPLMMAAFSPLAGRLADKMEPRVLASAGMGITVLGLILFIGLKPETPRSYIVANLILLGFGFALFSSPNMSAIMGAVEKRYYGIASGTVATMRLLGQMTSMAIAMVALAILVGPVTIGPDNHDRFLLTVRLVFTISALLCSLGLFFSWSRGSLHSHHGDHPSPY